MIISLNEALAKIHAGEIVAIPTETVYGLAADAFHPGAVQKIFEAKGRPSDNPLIVHISSEDQLSQLTPSLNDIVHSLAKAFWPGPLTLVMFKKAEVPDIVTAALPTVAVRMPDHPVTLELIRHTGPLTAPSANRSGKPSPTRASHVAEDFGDTVAILDGGECEIGLESTVLDVTSIPLRILRPGSVTAEMIQEITGKEVIRSDRKESYAQRSPGTRYTHYKPKAIVRWTPPPADVSDPNIYYLIHSNQEERASFENVIYFQGDFTEFAKTLYDHFRTADKLGCREILIEQLPPDPTHPVIPALRDRISKAAGDS